MSFILDNFIEYIGNSRFYQLLCAMKHKSNAADTVLVYWPHQCVYLQPEGVFCQNKTIHCNYNVPAQ